MSESPSGILKRIRKEKRVTIIELARRMGVSQAYIARLEDGEIQPTAEQGEVIKNFLDGNLDQRKG